MNKMPTAEEFFKLYSDNTSLSEGHYDYLVDETSFKEAMIEFAKLHVEAALKEASEAAFPDSKWDVENAYPLTNIK
jgi:hypothetical protein